MKSNLFLAIGGLLLAFVFAATPAVAVVVFSDDFESNVPGIASNGPGGYVAVNVTGNSYTWQVQGGSATDATHPGVILNAGADNSGVGGSIALVGTWDHTGAATYSWHQYTFYGQPGPGAGTPLNTIQVSMDVFVSGMENPAAQPIRFVYQQPATPGTPETKFSSTMVNNAYKHVEFTLNQTDNPSIVDPANPFNLQVVFDINGFGFDANNVLRIDNVLVQTIVPTVVDGDYNGDSKVDAADYTIWRDTFGSTTDLQANGDTTGLSATVIDNGDFAFWKAHFNGGLGSGGGGLGSAGVPEPASVVLALSAAVAVAIARRRRGQA